MKLEYVQVEGFKRFEESVTLQTSGKMVAIVGPNEAGKTSLLKAIDHLSHEEPIPHSDRTYLSETEPSIRAAFFLDQDDLEAAGLSNPTWLFAQKSADGSIEYDLTPKPRRDTSKRKHLASVIRQFQKSKSAKIRAAEVGFEPSEEKLIWLLRSLDGNGTWTTEVKDEFETFFNSIPDLSGLSGPLYLKNFEEAFSSTVAFERTHNPISTAKRALVERIPPILVFSDVYRDLKVPYNLNLYEHPSSDSSQPPSLALREILKIAGVNVAQLKTAAVAGNRAAVEGLIQDANQRLRLASDGVWTQSDATLFLRLDNTVLDVLVENKEGFEALNRYVNFSDRSDGYRQFIALQVLTFLNKASGSIILIDEIEQHLHYDGQSDLIQMLQNEPTIGKVIYTTHSAGALPEDLGRGVRLVHWDSKNPRISRIKNKFWQEDDSGGFRPLLFGMGATTLAFFPVRKAILTEGPTELLLLPQMMREASETENLDFQVVHGLSGVSPKQIPFLISQGSSACFFLDGDGGGKALRKTLLKADVDQSDIFMVSDCGDFLTLEDLLDEQVWLSSVNEYIQQFGSSVGVAKPIVAAPKTGRLKALPKALRDQKIRFAYSVLEIVESDPSAKILSASARAGLKKVFLNARTRLDLPNDNR